MSIAVQGQQRKYHTSHMFKVEVEGIGVAWFESCSEIKSTVGVIEQHEGGNPEVADEQPGKIKNEDVTLMAGQTSNVELYNWWQQVHDALENAGAVADELKRTVRITQLDRDKTSLATFGLAEAWPKAYTMGGWDAKAEAVVKETLVLRYKRPTRANTAA